MYTPKKSLYYLLVMYKDGSHDLFFTYAYCQLDALDVLYNLDSLVFDSVAHITCSPPKFI